MQNKIQTIVETIQKKTTEKNIANFVNVVNVNCIDDYNTCIESFDNYGTMYLSDFCRDEDGFPDMERFLDSIRNANKNILVLGFSQYARIRGVEVLSQYLDALLGMSINKKYQVVVLSYKIEKFLFEKVKHDVRLNNRVFIVQCQQNEDRQETIFTKFDLVMHNYKKIVGFKAYLRFLESNPTLSVLVKSNIRLNEGNGALSSVKFINNAFDAVLDKDKTINSIFDQDFGTPELWKKLLIAINKEKTFKKVVESIFSVSNNYHILFSNWNTYDDYQKWLYLLALKSEYKNNYLFNTANQSKNVNEFEKNIYFEFLKYNVSDSNFKDFYIERKKLMNIVNSEHYIVDYCAMLSGKGKDKVWYLTDTYDIEKDYIIQYFGEFNLPDLEIKNIVSVCYPQLASYLNDYYFKNPHLDKYFHQYKYQKIKNKIDDDFIELVNQNAVDRKYNYELESRIARFERLYKDDSLVYFFDAFGVEFLAYLIEKCNELGLIADVNIVRCNLPSITSENKDFLEICNAEKVVSIKDLDELKHKGQGDYNYEKTKFPLHIKKELEIIDSIVHKAKSDLIKYKKIIVVSDHGASRLAVIHNSKLDFEVDSKGTHGGRCCVYTESSPKIEYATEENGYYVLANYDRFKGGRTAQVETHGGATLEEIVVPIIELSVKKNNYEIQIVTKEVISSFKKKAEIIIVSNVKISNPVVKINEEYYDCNKVDGNLYYFVLKNDNTEIRRSGKYSACLFDGNNKLENDLYFEIKKEGAKDNDLL